MRGKTVLILLAVGIFFGCSAQSWLAQITMVQAEETYSKAYAMRVKKDVPYEKRLEFYRKACDEFSKAYDYDKNIFTLTRIESAIDACSRVNNEEKEAFFRAFEEKYIHEHPTEVEYGDAVPLLNVE